MCRRIAFGCLVLLLAVSTITCACGESTEAPIYTPRPSPTPSPTPTPTPESTISAQDWAFLNLWLSQLYGLPPVYTVDELQSAAWLVRDHWLEVADQAVTKLEQQHIPWERTAPFCYSHNWFVEAYTALPNASTPMEFLAANFVLTDYGQSLEETANELVRKKLSGEPLNIYPTEDACVQGGVGR